VRTTTRCRSRPDWSRGAPSDGDLITSPMARVALEPPRIDAHLRAGAGVGDIEH
jgi:hypothetical protein